MHLVVVASQPVLGQTHSVDVQVQYTGLTGSDCVGGSVDGLTNTSVLLQYRNIWPGGPAFWGVQILRDRSKEASAKK